MTNFQQRKNNLNADDETNQYHREALNTAQMAWRVSSSPQSGENSDISLRMLLLGDCSI